MASKKKAKPADHDPVFDRMAQYVAAEKTREYTRSPYNRAQVIMPPGKKYQPGTSDYVNKTKGRFRAAGQIYDRTYKDVLDFLHRREAGGKKPKTGEHSALAKKPKVGKASKKK